MSKPSAVAFHNVSFCYGKEHILQDITAHIEEGSYVGIVGPNGGGKTTFLKLLLGLLKPCDGHIELFGASPEAIRRAGKIGYVPQRIVQADFQFPATVREIVASGKPKNTNTLRQAMEITGVLPLADRLIGNLSGGERQKVFIARALASHPQILILDEPTTGVDSTSQEQFYALLKTLHRDHGLTILFVSHDVEVMASEADTILCLNQTLVAHCSPHDFIHTAEAKHLYGNGVSHIHHHHA